MAKSIHRALAALLCLTLCLCLFPAVYAGEIAEPAYEEYSFSYTYIDPIYADVLTEADIPRSEHDPEKDLSELRELAEAMESGGRFRRAKALQKSGPAYDSAESVAAALREHIKNCETSVTLLLICDSGTSMSVWSQLSKDIFWMACSHTGVSTEGDYLRYEHGGYSCDVSVVTEGGTSYCKFIYTLTQFTTAAQEAALTPVVDSILESLSLAGKSDYQKVFSIFRYLCDHVRYGGSGNQRFTAYGALVNGQAYCQGYSMALYRLCLEAGVDARFVSSSTMKHAWNIVGLGGLYYELDATWDTGYTPETYRYFLRGSTYWRANHQGPSIGDQFNDSTFAGQYPLPTFDYKPSITAQPAGVTAFTGSPVSFSASATGGELAYLWQTRPDSESEWTDISGAVSGTLSLTPAPSDADRLFRCRISNGADVLYSQAAELTLYSLAFQLDRSLADSVALSFRVGGAESYEGLKISWTGKDGTAREMPVTEGTRQADGSYVILLETFADGEWTAPVHVSVKDANGRVLKETACSVNTI